MLRSFFKYYNHRSFSSSRIRANMEKIKPSIPSEPPTSNSTGAVRMDFTPSEVDKKILIWSGKFKSADQIPPRISFSTMDNAKSIIRIKGAIVLMVCTLLLCAFYVYIGKKRRAKGDTITKRILERDQKYLEGYKK